MSVGSAAREQAPFSLVFYVKYLGKSFSVLGGAEDAEKLLCYVLH